MGKNSFTEADHQRLRDAIRQAETGTAGEIVCVVAGASGSYFLPALAAALGALLPASLVAALILDQFWLTLGLPVFVLAQLFSGASIALLLWKWPALQLRLTPRRVQRRAAHDNALRQFLARNVHKTAARTGVLVFVSRAEHHAEVIADSGIDARVSPGTWDGLVDGILRAARQECLADGLVQAVVAAGAHLAQHFPPQAGTGDELPDHLVEI